MISVHEFLFDSIFDFQINLFLCFTVTIIHTDIYCLLLQCLFTYKPDVNIGRAGETKDNKFFGRRVRWRLHLR